MTYEKIIVEIVDLNMILNYLNKLKTILVLTLLFLTYILDLLKKEKDWSNQEFQTAQ